MATNPTANQAEDASESTDTETTSAVSPAVVANTAPIENRSEIVFLYDAVDSNPNGDPLTEDNRPRIDDYTGQAIVTDVRLKRVVRDYLDRTGDTILVKASGEEGRDDKSDRYEVIQEKMQPLLEGLESSDGESESESESGDTSTSTSTSLSEEEAFLAVASDVRLFGDSMAFDESPVEGSFTGPAQFGFARSMHPVNVSTHGKTSVLAASSDEGDRTHGGNMFDDHRVDYALVRAHGVVNENAASDTGLIPNDVDRLDEALWVGTRSETNTSSKKGHEPRLLIRVEYAADNYHIGDLHRSITSSPVTGHPRSMRDISDVVLDASDFIRLLDSHSDRVDTVHIRASRRTQFYPIGTDDEQDAQQHDQNELLSPVEFIDVVADTVGSNSVVYDIN